MVDGDQDRSDDNGDDHRTADNTPAEGNFQNLFALHLAHLQALVGDSGHVANHSSSLKMTGNQGNTLQTSANFSQITSLRQASLARIYR